MLQSKLFSVKYLLISLKIYNICMSKNHTNYIKSQTSEDRPE